ncbi:MAG: penicillin-binding protein activator [Hyphomicrobiales bacterium]|nr:penicillin-binding protein activator [Hyphomicrobiales bacterium]MBV8823933.1 penicillin-binding protein activator [Hyphomicrobiales bacterium]MBV9426948.1 penicillin-binding protein activator [Bradyrhizobiaceae bacterium]
MLVAACSGFPGGDLFNFNSSSGNNNNPPPGPPQAAQTVGTGGTKVALILPLSAAGNAGLAATSMKNAAEMALAEFSSPNIQLLIKDDAGTAQGAQQATQDALAEGVEVILGPLFAHTVSAAGASARARGIPMIAFSTDANVAARGVYLLSFLPESDVDRVVDYAIGSGKRSFAGLVQDNPYGSVVEAEFQQVVARKGGRVIALERYPSDKAQMQEAVRRVAEAARQADTVFLPGGADAVPGVAQALAAAGAGAKRVQLIGTGLWDDPHIFADPSLQGGWFPAPETAGYKNFSNRYRARFGQDPVRTATLAYDAVSLVVGLVKANGPHHFTDEVLTNPSGFAGIDGIFRFRSDGTNQRGLAVLRVTTSGGQVVSPAPKSFTGSGT